MPQFSESAADKPLMALRSIRGEGKLRQFADLSLVGTEFFGTGRNIYSWWDRKTRFTVKVKENDVIYPYVHAWMFEMLPKESQRSLVLTSEMHDDSEDDDDVEIPFSSRPAGRKIVATSADQSARSFVLEGHKVRAWVVDMSEQLSTARDGRIDLSPSYVLFATRTRAGQEVVQRTIEKLAQEFRGKRRPRVNLTSSYGHWMARPDLPLRPLDTVVLKDGQIEALVADLHNFLNAEPDYVTRGLPWHRGYLFWGPPGTGKTSLARALAAHFKMDLWYLALSGVSSDATLTSLLSQVPPRSILLLEDIDILEASHNREGKKDQLSLAGLLNSLDGVATPHGLITIMTSNHKDKLDPALIRPGRIDWEEELNALDQDQAQRMFQRFYGHKPSGILEIEGKTAAELLEIFKQHMNDAAGIPVKERRQRRAQP